TVTCAPKPGRAPAAPAATPRSTKKKMTAPHHIAIRHPARTPNGPKKTSLTEATEDTEDATRRPSVSSVTSVRDRCSLPSDTLDRERDGVAAAEAERGEAGLLV